MKKGIFTILLFLLSFTAFSASAQTLYLLDGSSAEFETTAANKLLQGSGWYKEPMVRMENANKSHRKIVPVSESYTMAGYTKIASIPFFDKNLNVIYADSDESTYLDDKSLSPLTDPEKDKLPKGKKRLYTKDRKLATDVPPSWVDGYLQKGWHLLTEVYYPDAETVRVLDFEAAELFKNGGYKEPVMYVYKQDGAKKIIYKKELAAALSSGWSMSEYIQAYSLEGKERIMPADDIKATDGLYPYPVVRLYYPDGKTAVVAESEKDKYLSSDWFTYPVRFVYSPDSKQHIIKETDMPLYEALGWSTYPIMTVYAEDGRKCVIDAREFDAWNRVGWYSTPVVRMFSAYNPSVVIPRSDTKEWEAAGWSYVPMTLVYSLYGERAAVPTSEASKWLDEGWFSSPEELAYAQILSEYEKVYSIHPYNAFVFLTLVLDTPEDFGFEAIRGSIYEQYLYRKKAAAMDFVRTDYNAPLLAFPTSAVTDTENESFEICVINLSYENITAAALVATFYDEYKNIKARSLTTSDFPKLEPGRYAYITGFPIEGTAAWTLVNTFADTVIFENGTRWTE